MLSDKHIGVDGRTIRAPKTAKFQTAAPTAGRRDLFSPFNP
jgi:hypothetical protein